VSKNNDLSYASYEVKDEKQQTVPKSTLSSQEREKLIIMIKGLIRDRQQRDYGSMTLMGKEFGRSVRLVTKIEVENKEISLGSVKSDSAGYLYFKTSWGEYGIRSFKIEGDKVIDVDFLASSGIYDYVIEGDRLYTVEVNGMQVYSLKEGKMTKEASVFSQNFISIVVNDGIIYVGGKNGLYAYRVEGRTFKEIDHIMIYNINDIWGDNGYIYINNQGKGEMVVCKLIEDKFSKVSVLTELDFGIKKSSFADLPFTVKNNKLILSALGSIYSYDMKDGKIAEKVGIIGDSAGSNLLIHNEWLYVFDRTRNFLLVYDMNKNKEVISFNVGEYVHEIYVDDNYLIVNYNDKVEVFEIK
jgi:outer membrane protein assembly factor BamB